MPPRLLPSQLQPPDVPSSSPSPMMLPLSSLATSGFQYDISTLMDMQEDSLMVACGCCAAAALLNAKNQGSATPRTLPLQRRPASPGPRRPVPLCHPLRLRVKRFHALLLPSLLSKRATRSLGPDTLFFFPSSSNLAQAFVVWWWRGFQPTSARQAASRRSSEKLLVTAAVGGRIFFSNNHWNKYGVDRLRMPVVVV
ncbi:unnamed protein product [Linum trigynum]|uniref:Uncharacterized protein n=1 Tax=Linum trigynum TaxID=586398 RepID=A0AAV2EUI0_9ROSI